MYCYIDCRNEIKYDKLKDTTDILKKGGIGIFPTETVYGIGADCFNKNAVERIYNAKKRPREKALSVLVSDYEMINQVAIDITEEEKKIIKSFFPRSTYNNFKKES